jgi:hypothetical protein
VSGEVTNTDWSGYAATADVLVERITALIPEHPEILTMNSAWDLFKVEGFNCNDIGPSLFQASWALKKAQQDFARGTIGENYGG